MNAEEIQNAANVRKTLCSSFLMAGLRLLPDADDSVLSLLSEKGVTATVDATGLHLHQGQTEMVLSNAFETIRKEHPELFASDPRRDAISCREDFHGSASEIRSAKAAYIGQYGIAAWERLPVTRAEALQKAAIPRENMSRQEYLALPFKERSALAGIVGAEGIQRIMARTK
jgi:hypothetical protein